MPGDPHAAWAAWRHDAAAAAYWAGKITAALLGALTAQRAEQLARDYAAARPAPRAGRTDAELAAAALLWLATRPLDIAAHLTPVLRKIRTDGYLLGAASLAALADQAPADLGRWEPGATRAATTRITALGAAPGLDDALEDAGQQAAGIADTHRRRIARALALGTAAGQPAGVIGAALLATATAPAHGIALSVLAAAIGAAALFVARARQVPTWRWVNDPRSKVCPACSLNAAAGPIPVGHPFPSGDVSVPCHPSCACGIALD